MTSTDLQSRIAQWGRADARLATERVAKLRTATDAQRMQERLLIFADVLPDAHWLVRRTSSGIAEQQRLFQLLSRRT